jgi:hypothetical protein
MNSPRIEAAARALCRHASIECNVDADDNWQRHSRMFLDDAMIALAAADTVKNPDAKLAAQVAALQEQINFYRSKYGVTA